MIYKEMVAIYVYDMVELRTKGHVRFLVFNRQSEYMALEVFYMAELLTRII